MDVTDEHREKSRELWNLTIEQFGRYVSTAEDIAQALAEAEQRGRESVLSERECWTNNLSKPENG